MMTTTKRTFFAAAIAAASMLSFGADAQLKVPAPSPTQTIKQAFALSDITLEYSRPGAKGRVVFGDLVPYGKVWRTGANGATKITFADDVKVDGYALKAGTYALYTIPNRDEWEIMFYKDLTMGGNVSAYEKDDEVLRVKAKTKEIETKTETFTINFTDINPTSLNLEFAWSRTRVKVPITTEIDSRIMKNIENTVVNDSRPYYQAASYYYENDKDMKQALAWVEKAAEQYPKAYWVAALKGKIQLKMKDYSGATETANKVIAMATEDKNDDYVKIGQKIKADAKR